MHYKLCVSSAMAAFNIKDWFQGQIYIHSDCHELLPWTDHVYIKNVLLSSVPIFYKQLSLTLSH